MKKLVILGAGTAGTMMANKLRRRLPSSDWQITIVDRDDLHVYQPGLLFMPFGIYNEQDIVRSRSSFLPDGVEFRVGEIDRVDAKAKAVHFESGVPLLYDVLVVATGCRTTPAQTEGLVGKRWNETVFDFYTLEGARNLAHKLAGWKGGKLLLNIVEMPIKCPVAPLEFLFLADHFFVEAGIRDSVEIEFASPLPAAFTKPKAAAAFGSLLDQKNIALHTNFSTAKVDDEGGKLEAYDGRTLDFDILVTVPLHAGSEWIARSGIGDEMGFLPVDKHTLAVTTMADTFALGDTTDAPTSKAGSVAHFQGDVLLDNVERHIAGLPLKPEFDGHANCFIETGFGKAILIDFNYDTEPLPGRFPLPGIGPFSLLRETAVNHWGKLGFKWVYWNLLVRGHDMAIDHKMLMAGKHA